MWQRGSFGSGIDGMSDDWNTIEQKQELLSVPLPTVEHLLLLPLPPSTRVKLVSTIFYVMDLKPFKLDIDELINEFAENKMTNLADMKRILHI
ncbi:hypothetical protein Vadar_009079 [Vaccinium darrowii]|uniref:Uncharacterized protein n=1 Tax=Vaccinium darrowii TaxID=229202 RepID=A0ACB7XXS0_9ERIC|nr:hypothetical protein Vadar_009079 [Vaccinium darrowii]